MSDSTNILSSLGLEVDDSLTVENKSMSMHEHKPGDYLAFIGNFEKRYYDVEKKRCEADTPGARLTSMQGKFIIIKDPDGQIMDASYQIKDDIEYGRYSYNIYVTLDADKQWQNVNIFQDFTIDGTDSAAVVQGEAKSEVVHLNNLAIYVGIPVTFTLESYTSKAGKESIIIKKGSVELRDHTINKETYAKRKALVDSLTAQLKARADKMKAERAAEKAQAGDTSASTADTEGSFMGEFGGVSNNADDDLPF